jgi:hypothetical protein
MKTNEHFFYRISLRSCYSEKCFKVVQNIKIFFYSKPN